MTPTGAVSPPVPPIEGRAVISDRWGRVPGLFIVVALLLVVVALIPARGRIESLREEVDEVVEPAADLIAEVQYLLARETSSLRGYVISQDSTYLEQYAALRDRELEIYPELQAYAADLSPELAAATAETRALASQWHGRLLAADIAAAEATPETAVLLLEQDLYLQALEATGRAAREIRQLSRARQTRIDRAERNARFVYAFLFLLASLVALYMAVLNARIRTLATEAESRRAEIERAMRTTERAIAARADLIRGFTHDVKNPLGVADGYAELLQLGLRGDLEPPQLETVRRIRGAITGAIEITNELLDLSRLESGGLEVRREPVDLPALVRDTVQLHARAASAAGLDLTFVEADKGKPRPSTYTDPHRVRQILQNLISNALKYTPPRGHVRVRVDFPDTTDSPGPWARISVTDTGVGIPDGERDRIFDEFHRVPGTAAGGHGLGLAISRRIARLLGGDVTVQSAGEGSTFTLSLPVRHDVDVRPGSP